MTQKTKTVGVHESERLIIVERVVMLDTILGPGRHLFVNATDQGLPLMVVCSALFVDVEGGWLLQHIVVNDDDRRKGFAQEVVKFYEERIGQFNTLWASESGVAFGKAYVAKYGPRPKWQIGSTPKMDTAVDAMMDLQAKAKR